MNEDISYVDNVSEQTIGWYFRNYTHDKLKQERCSKCKRYSINISDSLQYKFCPYCGAKLIRKNNEVNN